jgi:FemAB-related protein (PEP-CTERM system-associated)
MSLGRGDDGWDRYVEQHPDGTCDHLWRWREIFQGVFGHECAYLTAHRDGTIVGVLPLVRFKSRLFGRFLVSVPFLNYGGVLASDPEAAAALLEYARETGRAFGASHVEFRHRARQYDELPFRQHKIGMRLDLPQSADVLWNRVDRKIRNQVRKAQKEQLTVDDGGAELVDDFYAVFATNMRDLGTPVYAKSLFAETLRAFPDRARVHVVRREGRPVAAGVTIACAQTVLVPWASSLREFRHLSPNMLLYWRMLEYSIGRGASVFDFGRSSPGGGTHHFKQQWGAVETPLHWEYVLLNRSAPPDQGPGNPRFSLAIEAWKRLPLWVANAVGPRVVRNVP